MAEECAACGASFGSPTDLVAHMQKKHKDHTDNETLAMNPESERPGMVCALCGRRFWSEDALARHNMTPHPRARPAPDSGTPSAA